MRSIGVRLLLQGLQPFAQGVEFLFQGRAAVALRLQRRFELGLLFLCESDLFLRALALHLCHLFGFQRALLVRHGPVALRIRVRQFPAARRLASSADHGFLHPAFGLLMRPAGPFLRLGHGALVPLTMLLLHPFPLFGMLPFQAALAGMAFNDLATKHPDLALRRIQRRQLTLQTKQTHLEFQRVSRFAKEVRLLFHPRRRLGSHFDLLSDDAAFAFKFFRPPLGQMMDQLPLKLQASHPQIDEAFRFRSPRIASNRLLFQRLVQQRHLLPDQVALLLARDRPVERMNFASFRPLPASRRTDPVQFTPEPGDLIVRTAALLPAFARLRQSPLQMMNPFLAFALRALLITPAMFLRALAPNPLFALAPLDAFTLPGFPIAIALSLTLTRPLVLVVRTGEGEPGHQGRRQQDRGAHRDRDANKPRPRGPGQFPSLLIQQHVDSPRGLQSAIRDAGRRNGTLRNPRRPLEPVRLKLPACPPNCSKWDWKFDESGLVLTSLSPPWPTDTTIMKPTDLRGILRYIPQFRRKTFVISVDGAVVADENFANILQDLAVLRSLNIRVVLAHGAAAQIAALAAERGQSASNLDGTGVTDDGTLDLAISAANRVTHEILEKLSAQDLRAAWCNSVTAHPVGIIGGVDHLHTGKVERVDVEMLERLLNDGIVPVIPPLGFDGEGASFRLNSDAAARALAEALDAVKLIYLTTADGLLRRGELIRQIQACELETALRGEDHGFDPDTVSKASHAALACRNGIPRAHVINGCVNEGLLAEVFSNEGIGTLVFANEYRAIRPARRKDIRSILNLTKEPVAKAELVERSRAEIEADLADYYIHEIDDNPVACVALHRRPDHDSAELAYLCVNASHENQGIGSRMAKFVEETAREAGVKRLFTVSAQTFNFFAKRGFSETSPDELPPERRAAYEKSGRQSKVLVKNLSAD